MSKQESETSAAGSSEIQYLKRDEVQKIISEMFASDVHPKIDAAIATMNEAAAKIGGVEDLVHATVAEALPGALDSFIAKQSAVAHEDPAAAAQRERDEETARIEREAAEAKERERERRANEKKAAEADRKARAQAAEDYDLAESMLEDEMGGDAFTLRFSAGKSFVPHLAPIPVASSQIDPAGVLNVRVDFDGTEPPALIDHAWLIGDGFARRAQLGAGLRIGGGAQAALPAGHLRF